MDSRNNYLIPENINVWDAENVFYLKSAPSRLAKLLSHWEIYNDIVSLPGALIECGVYKGASLVRFATFRSLIENDDARKIIGFDAFGTFPSDSVLGGSDREFIQRFEEAGGDGISLSDLENILKEKGFGNVELIKGDVMNTIPNVLKLSPHLRISLLHMDLDVYEPTRFALEQFFPHMVQGGIIVFDDYNSVEGATRAADEFCSKYGFRLIKGKYYNVPAFVKVENHATAS